MSYESYYYSMCHVAISSRCNEHPLYCGHHPHEKLFFYGAEFPIRSYFINRLFRLFIKRGKFLGNGVDRHYPLFCDLGICFAGSNQKQKT